jgi:predicted RNA binding protein YcfA (HicA-like mRNA interferase family)
VRLPRSISGADLARRLARLGYAVSRQTGSHMRLTRVAVGEQHVTIPAHADLKVGTLHSILRQVSQQTGLSREDLLAELFP